MRFDIYFMLQNVVQYSAASFAVVVDVKGLVLLAYILQVMPAHLLRKYFG